MVIYALFCHSTPNGWDQAPLNSLSEWAMGPDSRNKHITVLPINFPLSHKWIALRTMKVFFSFY